MVTPFRVLIVENSRTTLAAMSKLLETEGFEVETARNGHDAIEVVQSHPIDLVLMDLYMPMLNGYEAAQIIRAMPGRIGQVPIIALTASTDSKDINVCKNAGMNEFFMKSMGEDELVQLLKKYEALAAS